MKAEINDVSDSRREALDKYSSVSISCGEGACTMAREMAGTRYLIDEAPDLPLAKCPAASCSCRYASFRDRRSFLSNRRSNNRLETRPFTGLWRGNRRVGLERRSLKVDFNRRTRAYLSRQAEQARE